MRDVQDLVSGIHYLEMTSRPREEKKHDSITTGLTIVIGFMAMVILALAVA